MSRRAILGVGLAAVLLCLPLLGSLPLFDPDEGFYPAAAAESLARGEPLDLTLNGQPRWNKPPLSYALMEGSFLLLGKGEFAARLPSVLEGGALVVLLGLGVGAVAGGTAGFLASLVLASSLGFLALGRAAHPEMGLVLGVGAAQVMLALWLVSDSDTIGRWAPWAAGLAMGFGFLAKGPVALALPALMLLAGMLVLPRGARPSWGAVGRVFGPAALLALLLAAPWFLWMGARHGEVFWSTVFGQLGHYTSREYEHAANSPWYFVPVLAGGFLPWVALLPAALRDLRRTDPSPAERFRLLMALAAGTSFLFWSLSTSKLPNYGLVFLPPLAAVVGMHLAARSATGAEARRATLPARLLVLALGAGVFLVGVLLPAPLEPAARAFAAADDAPGAVMAILRLACVLVGLALILVPPAGALLARCGRPLGPAVGLALAPALALLAVMVPARDLVPRVLPAAPFASAMALAGDPAGAPVAVYRERMPSLTFYTGREVAWPHTPEELAAFLDAGAPGPRWLVIRERHLGAVPAGRPWTQAAGAGAWRLLRLIR